MSEFLHTQAVNLTVLLKNIGHDQKCTQFLARFITFVQIVDVLHSYDIQVILLTVTSIFNQGTTSSVY